MRGNVNFYLRLYMIKKKKQKNQIKYYCEPILYAV